MPRNRKTELTAEAVEKAIEEKRPSSLAQLARELGYRGSVSSWLRKKLTELVPDLAGRLAANKAGEKATANGEAPRAKKGAEPSGEGKDAERLSPFRPGTKYDFVWRQFYLHRRKGITRESLLEKMEKAGVSNRKTGYYAITVVASPDESGTKAHRSVSGKPADLYWVEKLPGGNLRLHLRDRKY